MTATAAAERDTAPPRRAGARVARALGWVLIAAGSVVLLYLVYSLWFTNLGTNAEQSRMLERWEAEVQAPAEAPPAEQPEAPVEAPGGAVALLEFHRPGSGEPPVRDGPLAVVAGVDRESLTRGPGHYPGTAPPGQPGNFAVAGHRTTYGAPFFRLDQLRAGDEVHAIDPDGVRHVYVVRDVRVVDPNATWVVGPDPLGAGRPLLTLTTCHPRFSAAQRLVVFAELTA